MTDEELIARLRGGINNMPLTTLGGVMHGEPCLAAADRIEALVKERDQWIEHTKNAVWTDSEELKLANVRAERLVEALRLARVHVANNAQGWSVSRASSRDDLTIIDAALDLSPTTVDASQTPDPVADDPRVKALVDALELQNIWVKAALECEAWSWDAQQHDAASESLDLAAAALRAIGGEA